MSLTHPLALTGERTLPGLPQEQYWFARHEALYRWVAYRWVAQRWAARLQGAPSVDAGCGEGYGAQLLRSAGVQTVVAVELDSFVVAHVRGAYPELHPLRANLIGLPLRSGSIRALVSAQVIEHLWDLPQFLAECSRVVAPGGEFIASTPNRLTFSPSLARGQRPTNPFHVEEFDAAQLLELAAAHLRAAAAGHRSADRAAVVLGVHPGRRLAAWEQVLGDLAAAQVSAVQADRWPVELAAVVEQVRWTDFEVLPDSPEHPLGQSLDLVLVVSDQHVSDHPDPAAR